MSDSDAKRVESLLARITRLESKYMTAQLTIVQLRRQNSELKQLTDQLTITASNSLRLIEKTGNELELLAAEAAAADKRS